MGSAARAGGPRWEAGFPSFWLAWSLGIFGGQVSQLTLPTVAILLLQAGPLAVGLLNALQFLPYPVLGLLIGALVDRAPRRRLILLSAACRALVLATVPAAFLAHRLSMAQLFAVAALNGTLAVVFTVACQSHLPDLVDREHLVDANSRLQFSRSGIEVTGPAIAGFMVQAVGAATSILVDALAHLAAAAATLRMRGGPEHRAGAAAPWPNLARQVGEGVALVWGDRVIRSTTASATTCNLGFFLAQSVFLLFVYRTLHLGPGTVGTLLALGSLGFLPGAALAAPASRKLGVGATMALSCLLVGAGLLLTPLAQLGLAGPVLVGTQFLISMQWPIFNANQLALRQQRTPRELQGRVSATTRTLIVGIAPLSSTLAGVLALSAGLPATIALGGAVAAAGAAWLLDPEVLHRRAA